MTDARVLALALVLAISSGMASSVRAEDAKPIYGIHDSAGFDALPHELGYVLETLTVQENDDPLGHLRRVTDAGVTVIGRINHGYWTDGTIPLVGPGRRYASYAEWGRAVAEMVRRSPHVTHWIIGNEINLPVEWPADESGKRVPISVETYATCYEAVYDAIKAVRPDAIVMPAPVAPYADDPGTGDGNAVACFANLMERVKARTDAVALHAYTHGQDPALVASEALMAGTAPPMHYEFRAYRDFLAALPAELRDRGVYVTESNPGKWTNADTGWVRAVFREVREWNAQPGTQKIRCVCLYRWDDHDPGYGLVKFPEVQKDFRAAMGEAPPTRGIVDVIQGNEGKPDEGTLTAASIAPRIAKPASDEYVIDFGDTLWEIAKRHGLSLEELLAFDGETGTANRDRLAASSPMKGAARKRDPNLIFPGQKVLVPRGRGR